MKSHASMNRIYRLVWNAALGIWVAVAENAKGRGKAGRAACALLAVLANLSPSAYAADAANARVVVGAGSVATSGTTTTINQVSQRLAIDWTQLSTAANEALRFNQPNAQAIALNRITGSSPSSFLGSLTANGQVFILNPNGVLFGAGSQVNVGGLVASTLSMSNADFMAGRNVFTNSGGTGSVVNKGTMTATQGGYLALLAPEVRNEGVMTASLGTALLAAGNKVTLNLDNGSLLGYSIDQGAINALAENKQLIKADGGQVLLSAKALDALTTATVNNTGVIEARTIQNKAGRIMLMGDMEHGTVNVGGTLDASAPTGGNGGFIETSAAHVKVATGTKVTALAANGKTGKWLIDPNDFNVAASGGDITGATLSASLGNADVELQSFNGSTTLGNGDINVNDAVSWSANTLTLTAWRNVNINAVMTASGTSALALNPDANNIQGRVTQGVVKMGLNSSGFTGRVDFGSRSGNGFLSINGINYQVINALGAAGSTTGYDLQGMASGGNYALGSDIDASATAGWNGGAGFRPLNISSNGMAENRFNGLGHTINNLTIYRPNTRYVGLFGMLEGPYSASPTHTYVSNIGIVGGSVTGHSSVGALAGAAFTSIINSYSTASVSGNLTVRYASESVGGLVGSAGGITIDGSYATGNITGQLNVGGLVGDFTYGLISKSSASGNVTGDVVVGGLVGRYSSVAGTFGESYGVVRSHATGHVSGEALVGGLIGLTDTMGRDNFLAVYATGRVSGNTQIGGLIGSHNGGLLNGSYATGDVTGTGDRVGGLIGYVTHNDYPNNGIDTVYASGNVMGVNAVGGLIGAVGDAGAGLMGRAGYIFGAHASGTVTGSSYVGGLVGELHAADMRNSYSTGNVTGSNGVGGLVGYNTNSIDGSYATSNVTSISSGSSIGGLVGLNGDGSTSNVAISNSYSAGLVNGNSGSYTGGLVGTNNKGSISNSYSTSIVNGNNYVGGLVGQTNSGAITSSHATGRVTATGYLAGGLIGYNGNGNNTDGSDVSNSYATGNVTGTESVGGLIGASEASNITITNSYATGTVFGTEMNVGGLVGWNLSTISNSYAVGGVTGTNGVGGLLGYNKGAISNSYAAIGSVTGNGFVGGLVGFSFTGAISNSYATGNVNGGNATGGLVGSNGSGSITAADTLAPGANITVTLTVLVK